MDYLDQILKKAGVKDFDELTVDEKESYFSMLKIAESAVISLDDVKTHIKAMKDAVEYSLANEKLSNNEDLFLKARLKNYLFFDNLLNKPERARHMLDQYGKTR